MIESMIVFDLKLAPLGDVVPKDGEIHMGRVLSLSADPNALDFENICGSLIEKYGHGHGTVKDGKLNDTLANN